jgi:23S rRNA (guanosine2251-2'-O)-methyltransferase
LPFLTDKNSILSAIRTEPRACRRLWIAQGSERLSRVLAEEARQQGVDVKILPGEDFARRFSGIRFVCLEREAFALHDEGALFQALAEGREILIGLLDTLYDPQNLGNIVRTAACLSVDFLVLPKDNSCGITDTVARIARGGLDHVAVVRIVNVARFLEEVKKRGVFCYGLDEGAPASLWEADLTGPVCLVLGSEKGLRRLTKERCDLLLSIPANEAFPSLNVANAFTIAAYEVRRQRAARAAGGPLRSGTTR